MTREAFPGWRPPAWVHVRVAPPGWIDDVSVPGRMRAHAPDTWLLLRADVYRRLRAARMEEVERVYVQRDFRGRPYLHAVTCCGRLVDTAVRVNAPPAVHSAAPQPKATAWPQVVPDGPVRYEARRGCGCGGVR